MSKPVEITLEELIKLKIALEIANLYNFVLIMSLIIVIIIAGSYLAYVTNESLFLKYRKRYRDCLGYKN